MAMPKLSNTSHVKRVVTLLLVGAALGLTAHFVLQPRSFGELGHYRADSLYDILDAEVVHQGEAVCGECHERIYQAHAKDIHFRVQCEDCHGPGNVHVKYHKTRDASIRDDQARMPKEYTLEGCLFCHRKLAARPRTFARIDPEEHYRFLHVTDPKTRCIECHDPHEPLFLSEPVDKARIHPVILECEACHDAAPQGEAKDVPGHPVIFVCRDCHRSVVKDFVKREHSFLRCTTCHLFYRASETSGRIFKNADRRFCLLCHEAKPFKDPEKLPQIVYEDHLARMAEVMRRDPVALDQDPAMCLTCHFDFIHDHKLIRSLQEQEP